MDGLQLGQVWKIKDHVWSELNTHEGKRKRLIPVAIVKGIDLNRRMVYLDSIVKSYAYNAEVPFNDLEEDYTLHSEPIKIVLKGLKVGDKIYVFDGDYRITEVEKAHDMSGADLETS